MQKREIKKDEIEREYQESEASLKEKMAQEKYEEAYNLLQEMQETVMALIMNREGFTVMRVKEIEMPDTNPAGASFNAPDWALRQIRPNLN